jgi:hypothetical protein
VSAVRFCPSALRKFKGLRYKAGIVPVFSISPKKGRSQIKSSRLIDQ